MLPTLSAQQIAEGLRDGRFDASDEVRLAGETAWLPLEAHPQFAELVEELEAPPPRRHEEPTHLDMNALIDVCLVLLIFFILTTTYAMAVQKVVEVPTTQKDGKKARVVQVKEVRQRMVQLRAYKEQSGKPVVQIENTTRDVVTVEGLIDKTRLADELRREARGEVNKTELLLDARDISWGTFIALQDAARSAGIEKINQLNRTGVK
jgi:biopolymer transport protein ExbD